MDEHPANLANLTSHISHIDQRMHAAPSGVFDVPPDVPAAPEPESGDDRRYPVGVLTGNAWGDDAVNRYLHDDNMEQHLNPSLEWDLKASGTPMVPVAYALWSALLDQGRYIVNVGFPRAPFAALTDAQRGRIVALVADWISGQNSDGLGETFVDQVFALPDGTYWAGEPDWTVCCEATGRASGDGRKASLIPVPMDRLRAWTAPGGEVFAVVRYAGTLYGGTVDPSEIHDERDVLR